MKPTNLAIRLTAFLSQYLPAQRNLSPNTIRSYRDTFTLLLRYCRDHRDLPPEKLNIGNLETVLILDFLGHIEEARGCGTSTRNVRLTALQSFFRYLQTEEPDQLAHCQRILAIPRRRHPRPMIDYLSADELAMILGQPDLDCPSGRRDLILLSVLYDTGARVQEVIDLRVRNVRLEAPAQIRLIGKGRKQRTVPILRATVSLLANYIQALDLARPERLDAPLIQNKRGEPLSRSGVRYILDKYVAMAREQKPDLMVAVTPHTFRHSKAMHLLQAGNPIVVIRDILGHADIRTTSMYARADPETLRKALEKVAERAPDPPQPSWQNNPNLMDWLRGL